MSGGSGSRFDAETVVRVKAVKDVGRLEIHLRDDSGTDHVVSLPLPKAVALGHLVCDLAEAAPFLMHVPQPSQTRRRRRS